MIKAFIKICNFFSKKTNRDGMTAYASDTTLYIIISFFPFLMFLMTLLQYLPFSRFELLEVISRFVPSQVYDFIAKLVHELYSTSSIVLSITIVTTLWSASRGIVGIYRGLNSIYGIEETRNYLTIRLRSMLYTLIFVIMLIMLLGTYVFGNLIIHWINSRFPTLLLNKYAIVVVSFRTTIGILILTIFFLIMYKFIPNRKTRLFREFPGAILAASGWVAFSYLYSFYINNLSNMTATYGSLTAIVLCMLWLYMCMCIFFFGAEINSILAEPQVKEAIRQFLRGRKRKSAAGSSVEGPNDAPKVQT